jgi:hypothetical protein
LSTFGSVLALPFDEAQALQPDHDVHRERSLLTVAAHDDLCPEGSPAWGNQVSGADLLDDAATQAPAHR